MYKCDIIVCICCHPPCGGCGLKLDENGKDIESVSHPPCGGCGLKSTGKDQNKEPNGHPPCGGCGLKCQISENQSQR